jgi:prepilin-type N-terminal cleavage/methylation domain-containing protein
MRSEPQRARGRAARRGRGTWRRQGRRGFTLIELMIALVVSSLLIGMLFAIFIRMSVAYRSQQQVAEVQGKLAAARAKIEQDAKQAGLRLANGFHMADLPATMLYPALRVTNGPNGAPDQIAFYYADPSVQAVARNPGACNQLQCDALDSTDGFQQDDVVVMSLAKYDAPDFPGLAKFDACVFQLASVGTNSFVFSTADPWGTGPDNSHCLFTNDPANPRSFYKLAVRAWRIDPSRPADGVLQLSTMGALIGRDDWQDQAYGFTDLQVATRFFELNDVIDTPDPDDDPLRDWYSGTDQDNLTREATADEIKNRPPIQVSISLVARTERDVEGIASTSTPNLTAAGNENYNTIGDHGPVALPSTLPTLTGNRIYRYTTFQVDLRNLGVGR